MLIPRKMITIKSSKSDEQIIQTMRSMTEETTTVLRIKDKNKLFFGHVEAPEFVIFSTPEDFFRNIFLEIKVRMLHEDKGVTIDLIFRPWLYERVLATFMYAFTILFFTISLFLHSNLLPLVISFILFIIIYLLTRVTFDYLYKKIITILTDTLS